MILIVKNKETLRYVPKHETDMPVFMHCCAGFIEVTDISVWIPVFNAHGIQVMIQDETISESKDGSPDV